MESALPVKILNLLSNCITSHFNILTLDGLLHKIFSLHNLPQSSFFAHDSMFLWVQCPRNIITTDTTIDNCANFLWYSWIQNQLISQKQPLQTQVTLLLSRGVPQGSVHGVPYLWPMCQLGTPPWPCKGWRWHKMTNSVSKNCEHVCMLLHLCICVWLWN